MHRLPEGDLGAGCHGECRAISRELDRIDAAAKIESAHGGEEARVPQFERLVVTSS